MFLIDSGVRRDPDSKRGFCTFPCDQADSTAIDTSEEINKNMNKHADLDTGVILGISMGQIIHELLLQSGLYPSETSESPETGFWEMTLGRLPAFVVPIRSFPELRRK
jgi:hypothetical protein